MLVNQQLPVKGGPWKDICQLNIKEQRIKDKMLTGLAMEVRNGRSTLLWEDNWLQDGPLKWRRELFKWEMELVHQFHERLRPVKLSDGKEDNMVWKLDSKGVFSTKSIMQVLQSETLSDEITSYSFTSSVWRGVVPPRIELFGWFVLVGRVNIKERLSRLGIVMPSDNICVLCKKEIESVKHLFLLCELTWQVWCSWLRSFSEAWAISGTIRELFESWTGRHKRKQEQERWLTGFFAVIWNI
nr:uncharacterized protein LOC112743003 [Arachis hypogaea]